MPITSSAKKALRVSRRKRVINLARKGKLTDVVKKFKKLVADKKLEEARKLFPELQQALDKSAKSNIIKKGTAARKKARFVAMLKKKAV
jgi:ribosomal protein S20